MQQRTATITVTALAMLGLLTGCNVGQSAQPNSPTTLGNLSNGSNESESAKHASTVVGQTSANQSVIGQDALTTSQLMHAARQFDTLTMASAQPALASHHASVPNQTSHTKVINLESYSNPAKGIYYTNRVVIATFHDMSPTSQSFWNMTPATFATDLQTLQRDHFNVITNQQFTGWLEGRNAVPVNAVLLTFDDGYESMYTQALPILMANHMTGTFFDIVSTTTGHPGFMTWPEIQTMEKDGMTIESHTYNLHYTVKMKGSNIPVFDTPLTRNGATLTPSQWYNRDYQDFLQARTLLEQQLGHPITQFAWPYGWGNHIPFNAAIQSGYRFIYTMNPGIVTPWTSPYGIPRIDVGHSDTTPQKMVQHILQTAGVQVPSLQ